MHASLLPNSRCLRGDKRLTHSSSIQPMPAFKPYNLRSIARAQAVQAEAVATRISVEGFFSNAAEEESRRFDADEGDLDRTGAALRPDSPPTVLEADSETDVAQPPEPLEFMRPPPGQAEKTRKRKRNQQRRQKKRLRQAESSHQPDEYTALPRIVKAKIKTAEAVRATGNALNLPTSSGGSWIGKRQPGIGDEPWKLEELQRLDFGYLKWDGVVTMLVLDSQDRIMVICVGRPGDEAWPDVCHDAAGLLDQVLVEGLSTHAFHEKYLSHRRGDFVALPVGVSHGGGQVEPGTLQHSQICQRLVNRLLSAKSIRRIAGFQSSAFAAFAPKLYRYYALTLKKLFDRLPLLQHNFRNSIFPAVSFNLGPSSISLAHTDYGNLSHGLCALTALGNYDPTKGGHMILFQLRLVIEFPPCSTIILPSGSLDHGNTPIQHGETRLSIAQYAAGGLFRWVAYGFSTIKSLIATKVGRDHKARVDMDEGERWKWGIELLSKHGELAADVENVYRAEYD